MTGADTPAWSVVLSQTESSGLACAHQKFATIEELTAFLAAAQKNNTAVVGGAPGRIPPETRLTSLVFCDLAALNKVIEHAQSDQVVNVQCGITVGELNAYLARHKQWWPVYAPDQCSVLDVIAGGDGGALDFRFGGPRDLTLGMTVALASGNVIRCGGKVVKNVTGFDMTKLFVGSRNWLGLPVSAWLRLYALPETSQSLLWPVDDGQAALSLSRVLIQSGLPFSSVLIVNNKLMSALAAQPQLAALPAGLALDHGQLAVLVQLHGLEAVVAQVVHSAMELTSAERAQPLQLAGEPERQLWRLLSQAAYAEADQQWLHINAPMSLMNVVFHTLGSETSWQARPASGRIDVQLAAGDAPRLVQKLGAGRPPDEPIVVSYADDRYNCRVSYLPHQDPALPDLKLRLKDKFDPSGILNPFTLP